MPCCGLIPGGAWKQITAGQAGRILESVTPAGAVAAARWELAAEHAAGLRGIDAQIRQTRKRIDAAVRGAGTSLTGIFGAGPVIAAAVIGDVRDVSRFPSRDHFASCNGTAPVEVSPGQRKTCRLSRRGSRRLNHAIHMAAVTQIRCRHSNGRAYYDKKLAEGKTPEEALRALKRQVSDAIYTVLPAGARKAAGQPGEPGRATGGGSHPSAAGSHPQVPALRESHSRTPRQPTTPPATPADPAPALSRTAADPGERAGRPGPGAARPRSGARKGVLDAPARRADNARQREKEDPLP
jgi:transposase